MKDFLRFVAHLMLVRRQLIEPRQTRFALGLPAFGVLPHPLELGLHRLHARVFLLRLALETFFFLLKPRAVVAFIGNPATAIELENPFGRIVEKVAIVRDRDHRARKTQQELFEPVDALGIQMVGRLVEQQHVRLRQQQLAQRDAALFAAGQRAEHGVPGRQTQRVGRDLHLMLGVLPRGRENGFVLRLLSGQVIEIRVGLRVSGVNRFELFLCL